MRAACEKRGQIPGGTPYTYNYRPLIGHPVGASGGMECGLVWVCGIFGGVCFKTWSVSIAPSPARALPLASPRYRSRALTLMGEEEPEDVPVADEEGEEKDDEVEPVERPAAT